MHISKHSMWREILKIFRNKHGLSLTSVKLDPWNSCLTRGSFALPGHKSNMSLDHGITQTPVHPQPSLCRARKGVFGSPDEQDICFPVFGIFLLLFISHRLVRRLRPSYQFLLYEMQRQNTCHIALKETSATKHYMHLPTGFSTNHTTTLQRKSIF
jgi:hypothetical protein